MVNFAGFLHKYSQVEILEFSQAKNFEKSTSLGEANHKIIHWSWLVGWLVGGWVGGWVGWLVGWLVGWVLMMLIISEVLYSVELSGEAAILSRSPERDGRLRVLRAREEIWIRWILAEWFHGRWWRNSVSWALCGDCYCLQIEIWYYLYLYGYSTHWWRSWLWMVCLRRWQSLKW